MSEINIAVIQFPGANCERETHMALARNGLRGIDVFWNHRANSLNEFSGFVIIGGFSYEDRGRAGLIASADPLINKLKNQSAKGKPILGICNGAQILVESGLVPGINSISQGIALTQNKRIKENKVQGTGYFNDWVYVKPKAQTNASCFNFTRSCQPMHIPIAHAEGRFVMTKALLDYLNRHGATLWQYCDVAGVISDEFPINPNGSIANLAGISNLAGNVLALMPHPERTTLGDGFFSAMRQHITAGFPLPEPVRAPPPTLNVQPLTPYARRSGSMRLVIQSKLTDDTALSMQNVFRDKGLKVTLKRYRFFDISFENGDKTALLAALKQTGELYNANKEVSVVLSSTQATQQILIRPKEDIDGMLLTQKLHDYYGFSMLKSIHTGTLWHIIHPEPKQDNDFDEGLRLLYHPQVQWCDEYNTHFA